MVVDAILLEILNGTYIELNDQYEELFMERFSFRVFRGCKPCVFFTFCLWFRIGKPKFELTSRVLASILFTIYMIRTDLTSLVKLSCITTGGAFLRRAFRSNTFVHISFLAILAFWTVFTKNKITVCTLFPDLDT